MKTKRQINKSEEIRKVGRAMGRGVRPKEVIAKLAGEGITVTSAQVSTVLSKEKQRRGPGRPGRPPAVVVGPITLDSLLAAKKLVSQLGSVEAAKTAVNALAQLA